MQKQDIEGALYEDAAGQNVLRAVEQAETLNKVKAKLAEARAAVRNASCPTEDDHDFASFGQCRRCGAHRAPAR